MKRSRTRFEEERKEKSQSRIDEPVLSTRERTVCTLAIFLRSHSRPRRFDLFASRIPRKPGRTGVSNGEIPSNDLRRRSKREKEEKVDARGERGCKVFIYRNGNRMSFSNPTRSNDISKAI